jgi:hypothetical protein
MFGVVSARHATALSARPLAARADIEREAARGTSRH